jgi:SAM-dependent methyltransferase
MVGAAAAAADTAVDQVDARRIPAFLDDLDAVALLAMAATISDTGLFDDGSAHDATEIADALRVAERHRWILRRWLVALAAENMVTADGDAYRGLRPVTRSDLHRAAREIDRARRGLGYPPELTRFFQSAIEYLPELLRDEIPLQALLFADGETGAAEGVYRDNVFTRYVNAATARVVRWQADRHPTRRPVRVLEVGAGVGATTGDIVAALAPHPLDYLFTDVSRFFLVDAEQRFAGTEGLHFARFDINADATVQGVPPGSRDVVLGANVLHNALDIAATLRGLGALLAPEGMLVFIEATRETRHILTSMQFLMSSGPGHDQPGTRDRRAGTDRIFLTGDEWVEELRAAGFAPLGCLPAPGHPLYPIGVQVFVATRTP